MATINILKKHHPAKIVIAVPVTSQSAYDMLSKQVDELIALKIPINFLGVGAYYEQFEDVSEEQVLECMEKAKTFSGK